MAVVARRVVAPKCTGDALMMHKSGGKAALRAHFRAALLTAPPALGIVRRFPEARPAHALDGCQTGTPRDAGQHERTMATPAVLPQSGETKIASVPATPFTWKGYAGRNFETELTSKRTRASGSFLRAATVAVPV